MHKKRIAFYIESFIVGGAEKVLIDLVNNLDQDKFEIHVISIFKNSVYPHYSATYENVFKPYIKYHFLIDNELSWRSKLFNLCYNRLPKQWIYKVLIKGEFDVEVAFYEGFPTTFVSYSTQPSKKIAWLHTLQTNIYKNLPQSKIEENKVIYSKYDTIVGVSDAVSKSFSDIFSKLQAKICYNPINDIFILKQAEDKCDFAWDENQLTLVSVGRLTEVKGFERLLNVLAKLSSESYSFQFLLIGDGHLHRPFSEQIKNKNLTGKVFLLGHQQNPYPYIKNADCLISSSYYEGLPTVLIEAQILQTPVIATDCGGTSEIVNIGNGLLCENSEHGLYVAIKSILVQPNKLKEIKENFKKSKPSFNLQSSVDTIEKILLQ